MNKIEIYMTGNISKAFNDGKYYWETGSNGVDVCNKTLNSKEKISFFFPWTNILYIKEYVIEEDFGEAMTILAPPYFKDNEIVFENS